VIKKVAVLMGGKSFEREISLASGKYICESLEAQGYKVLPLDTTENLTAVLRRQKPDMAYVALHGQGGEDGTVQSLLEYLNIPFFGSSSEACKMAFNKSLLHYATQQVADVHVPKYICFGVDAFKNMGLAGALTLVKRQFKGAYPVMVKPAHGGSGFGVHMAKSQHELAEALLDAYSYDKEVLIQEYVKGVEVAVGVVQTSPGAANYPLGGAPHSYQVLEPVEIVPAGDFYDIAARQDPEMVEYFAPIRWQGLGSSKAKAARTLEAIKRAAVDVAAAFGVGGISRVDMIWDGKRLNLLEISVSPGMHEDTLIPLSVRAAGLEFGPWLAGLLESAAAPSAPSAPDVAHA
jgi:D-alanine-D-alanine ligase